MTYPNDPNRSDINRGLDPAGRRINESWGTGPIILASLAALAVVFGLFFMMSDRNSDRRLQRKSPGRDDASDHDRLGCHYHSEQSERHNAAKGYEPAGAGSR